MHRKGLGDLINDSPPPPQIYSKELLGTLMSDKVRVKLVVSRGG